MSNFSVAEKPYVQVSFSVSSFPPPPFFLSFPPTLPLLPPSLPSLFLFSSYISSQNTMPHFALGTLKPLWSDVIIRTLYNWALM